MNLSEDHEYVLVYRKTLAGAWNGRIIDRSDFQNPDDDPRGPYVTDPLTGKATAANRPNLHFVITNPESGDKYEPDSSRGWITDLAGVEALITEKRVWWPPDPNTGKPRKKRYLSETSERMPESSFWGDVRGQSGADELDQILRKRLFDFPKLTDFLVRLIDVSCGPDALILDCTAGSGTTGHAVLSLNKRDNGKRQFVLVQNRHDNQDQERDGLNICDQVTAQRIRSVATGYAYKKPKRGGGEERVNIEPIGGTFTYARIGEPLFSEYRNFGKKLPDWETLARYAYYTETGIECDSRKLDETSGFIGSTDAAGGTSYYLFYSPDKEDNQQVSLRTLPGIVKKDKNKTLVVYAERIWLHADELAKFEAEHGRKIRPMVIPFGLK